MAEQLGREHLRATPSVLMEELPHGAVLWLTRPTPADFDSDAARLAQAEALVHLRPSLSLDDTLASLRERSLAFVPVPFAFHPDIADILPHKLPYVSFASRRQWVQKFNQYTPPPVSECLPARQVPPSDVQDVHAAIDHYEGLYLWHQAWGHTLAPDAKASLIPALGAFLGMLLVHWLGGQWLPRNNLDEAAVVLGDTAWLPFLRARHSLQSRDTPLDYSLTQLFREARRRTLQ